MRVLSTALVALTVLVLAARAQADPDVDGARARFKAGEAFFNAGLFDRAVDEYRAAYALVPRPQLLFNIGSAYRRKAESTHARRDLEAAIDHYERYLEAEPDGKGAEAARAYVTALRAEASSAAPDPEPAPPPPAAPAPAPLPAPPLAASPSLPSPVDRPDRARTWRIAGLATAGTGAALVGVGVAFALKARSSSDELQGLSEGDAWNKDKFDSGRRAERIAAVCLSAGGVAVATGTLLYLVLGRRRDVQVTPAVGADGGSVLVSGAF